MPGKPTIVLVAGAWHDASTWDKVTPLLAAQQYRHVSIGLPSATGDASKTFLDDLTAVRDAIQAETAEGRDVVVVVHSYGGVVGESAIKGLARDPKKEAGKSGDEGGHVIGLVMMATGFQPTGMSFMQAAGGTPPPSWRADRDSGLAALVADPRELFYHDLPEGEEEGQRRAGLLRGQSLRALYEGGEHVYAGWADVPVFFCVTADDRALPPDLQRTFPDMARRAGAAVTVREIASGHSPMLSRPAETADIIVEAATAFRAA